MHYEKKGVLSFMVVDSLKEKLEISNMKGDSE